MRSGRTSPDNLPSSAQSLEDAQRDALHLIRGTPGEHAPDIGTDLGADLGIALGIALGGIVRGACSQLVQGGAEHLGVGRVPGGCWARVGPCESFERWTARTRTVAPSPLVVV